jgi:hypothetical protein
MLDLPESWEQDEPEEFDAPIGLEGDNNDVA